MSVQQVSPRPNLYGARISSVAVQRKDILYSAPFLPASIPVRGVIGYEYTITLAASLHPCATTYIPLFATETTPDGLGTLRGVTRRKQAQSGGISGHIILAQPGSEEAVIQFNRCSFFA